MPFKDKLNHFCGFLDIDEQDKRKRFQRRYVILKKEKGLLEWYLDSPSNLVNSQPCGMINLDYITKVDEAKKMKLDYCFVINTPFRPYYIQASSQTEVEEWVNILNDASKITVPPEAIHPQLTSTKSSDTEDKLHKQSFPGDGHSDASEPGCTYRTEIVGNVVIKKKLTEVKKSNSEEPSSPSINSTGSAYDYKLPLTPDNTSVHSVFFNTNDDKDVIQKGWAVKQGHVRKNWKRRYFILKKDGFAYFKSELDKEPIRTVSIGDILAAKVVDGEMSRLRDNLLLVITTDKIYYMQVDTPDDVKGWVNAFNDTVKANQGKGKKSQVTYGESYSLGRSVDVLDETHGDASAQMRAKFTKHSSAQILPLGGSQESIGCNSAYSTDSVDKMRTSGAAGHSEGKKTHRRAESDATFLQTRSVEGMPSAVKGNRKPLEYNAEDVKARPETLHHEPLSGLAHVWKTQSPVSEGSSRSSSRPTSGDFVLSHLDPQVDLRSAVKPSLVKKKKSSGILFSLNTMLTRKHDKIQKDKTKYKVN